MANWQGWNAQDLGTSEDGPQSGPPGVFRPDGTFQWYDGRTEPTVLIAEKDPSGAAYTDAQGTRVPVSVATANNLTKLGTPQADPDYNGGSLFKDILTHGILPAAAIIGGGSALAGQFGAGLGGATASGGGGGGALWNTLASEDAAAGGGAIGNATAGLGDTFTGAGAAGAGAGAAGLGGAGTGSSNALWNTLAADDAAAGGGPIAAATAGAGNTFTGAGALGATSALSRILNGTANADDYLSLGGKVAPALLGAYASNQQSGAQQDLATKYEEFGAPSRARYEASYAPGFDLSVADPAYKGALDSTMGATLSKLSTQGNPFGNPGGLIEANKQIVNGTALPALQNYRGTNAASGGFSTYNAAAPAAASNAINSNANQYNAIGYGIDQATQPQASSIEQILKALAGKSTSAAGLA